MVLLELQRGASRLQKTIANIAQHARTCPGAIPTDPSMHTLCRHFARDKPPRPPTDASLRPLWQPFRQHFKTTSLSSSPLTMSTLVSGGGGEVVVAAVVVLLRQLVAVLSLWQLVAVLSLWQLVAVL